MTIHTQASSTFTNPEIYNAAQAAVNVVNAGGGINGHKLKLINCNEGDDPNLATQCGVQAESSHVSAIVGAQSVYSSNYYPYLQAAHIPNIGDSPETQADQTNGLSFAWGASPPLEFTGLGIEMAKVGCTKIAVLSPAIAALQLSISHFESGVTSVSSSITFEPTINFPLGNPNDAPQAEDVVADGADCAVALTDSPDMANLLGEMHQLAPNVKVGWINNELTPSTLKGISAAADGEYAATQAFALGTATPQTTAFKTAMQKYFPAAEQDELAENAWASVMVFAKVAKTLKSYQSYKILSALKKQCNLNVPLYSTVDFCKAGPVTASPRLFNASVYLEKTSNGSYVLEQSTAVNVAAVLNG